MAAVPPKRRRSPLRRWYHKLALRAKLRWFGLVPACAIAWAAVEARSLAAQATGDSLITTLLVRQVIGEWRDSTYRGYCLTWVAAREDRPHVLFLLDAVAADTTQTPPCVAADGTRYPVLLDAPACPPEERIRVTDREWILIRCGPASFARYRRQPEKRT